MESQGGQEEGPIEETKTRLCPCFDIHVCVTVVRSSLFLVKPLYSILESRYK